MTTTTTPMPAEGQCGRARVLLSLLVLIPLVAVPCCGENAAAAAAAAAGDNDDQPVPPPPPDAWFPDAFPNPRHGGDACGRGGVQSRVCDPNGVLPRTSADTVEELIRTLQTDTRGVVNGCRDGFQLAVAVANRISANYLPGAALDRKARAFALALHDTWGVGDPSCQDGIVLFLSKEDRKIHISTGSGAKVYLTSSGVQRVIGAMRADLRAGRFGKAVERAVHEIAREVSGGARKGNSVGDEQPRSLFELAAGWVVAIVIIVLMCGTGRSGTSTDEYTRARRTIQRLEREREAAQRAQRFDQPSCPVCLEEFARGGGADETRPELLACGHKFCLDCLEEWLQRSNACPICRQPVVRVGQAPQSAAAAQGSGGDGAGDAAGDGARDADRGEDGSGSGSGSGDRQGDSKEADTGDGPGGGRDGGSDSSGIKRRRTAATAAAAADDTSSSSSCSSPAPPSSPGNHWRSSRAQRNPDITRHRAYDHDEWVYRMDRMHYLHPNVVTTSMRDRWSSRTYSSGTATLRPSEDSEFLRAAPSYAKYEGTGSSGWSSFDGGDFGGGSSSGGGGGGGGW